MSQLFNNVKPGDMVHYLTPQGQHGKGKAVLAYDTHVVVNRGKGQPAVVTDKNYVKHSRNGKIVGALLSRLSVPSGKFKDAAATGNPRHFANEDSRDAEGLGARADKTRHEKKKKKLQELNTSTLTSYVTKAIADRKERTGAELGRLRTGLSKYYANDNGANKKISQRSAGIKKAVAKIASNLPAEPLKAHTDGEASKYGGWSGMESVEINEGVVDLAVKLGKKSGIDVHSVGYNKKTGTVQMGDLDGKGYSAQIKKRGLIKSILNRKGLRTIGKPERNRDLDEAKKKAKAVNWQSTKNFSVLKFGEGGIPLKHHMARLAAVGIPSRKGHSPYVGHTALEVPAKYERKAGKVLYGESVYIDEQPIVEVSAPGKEEWIKANKQRFIAKYGKEKGLRILYAKAWKDSKNESVDEGVLKSIKRGLLGWGDGINPKEMKDYHKNASDSTLIRLAKGSAESPTKHSPRDLQIKLINRELKKRYSVKEARENEYSANIQLAGQVRPKQPGHYLMRDGRKLSGPHSPEEAVRVYKNLGHTDTKGVKIVHVKESLSKGKEWYRTKETIHYKKDGSIYTPSGEKAVGASRLSKGRAGYFKGDKFVSMGREWSGINKSHVVRVNETSDKVKKAAEKAISLSKKAKGNKHVDTKPKLDLQDKGMGGPMETNHGDENVKL